MRFLVFLLVVICLIGCRSSKIQYSRSGFELATIPTSDFPFQVLHAEGVQSKLLLSSLIRYDYVDVNDTLQLSNAHLILVHYSGKFLEFEGDTSIVMGNLNKDFFSRMNLTIEAANMRPKLAMLFSEEKVLPVTTTCMRGSIDIVWPNDAEIEAHISKILIVWLPSEAEIPKSYVIRVRNIFDEEVARFETVENFIQMDLTEYKSDIEEFAIVEVFPKDDVEEPRPMGIRFVDRFDFVPEATATNTAIGALEFASFLRWRGFEHYEHYFLRAFEISNQTIYKDLLIWNAPLHASKNNGK